MSKNDGLVSVIIPVFNRKALVARAIDSVLAQTYQDLEVVLIDDGSTDGSGAVLDEYTIKHPGRVKVIHQKNAGQVVARNNGIKVAIGKYIAFLDSDDTWLPHKLDRQIPLFQKNVGLVYAGIFEVDGKEKIVQEVRPEKKMRGNIFYQLLEKNAMTGGSVVVTRESLDRVGLFDEKLKAAENWDLWIRISKHFLVDFVDEPLIKYLKHDGNMSSDMNLMQKASMSIYAKHLSEVVGDERLKKAKARAYAYLHYCNGVAASGKGNYVEARREFLACWNYSPFYHDTVSRFFRTFLGRKGNALLSQLSKFLR
jgi:glycosyltransferase involved in cell wall biosynthesis